MSWQLASFAVLALALVAGFAWYERSRPSAKLLALAAALAALTVVGRLAFAAFPNVKPTTDMVLLSGYALGPAPGFAVGAITPLVSNIVLTHGPWTPWQMAGWGAIGIFGALLAKLMRGRELSRWTLALVCGLAGFAFGALMDTYQWTLAAEQTPRQWLAIASTSLPYNVAHALGNVVFCLAVGPAFLRALQRCRRRFEVRWPAPEPGRVAPGGAVAAAVVAALVLAGFAGAPRDAAASPSSRALDYLRSAQNDDGGLGPARGQRSSQLHSGWAALGIAAAGLNPRELGGSRSLLDYIRQGAGSLREVGDLERTVLVARASGVSPRDFLNRDLVSEMLRFRRRDGSFSGFVSYTSFGVLALRAAGEGPGSSRVRKSVRWLLKRSNGDGGFGVAPRAASDVDNTAAVLQALAAGGRRSHPAVRRALRYLRRAQNGDGGFGASPIRASNAQSTAYAVLGIVAAGRSPERFGSRSPLRYLRRLQRADGSVRYSRTSAQTPVWVTAQALLAFEREPLPVGAARLAGRSRGGAPGAGAKRRGRGGGGKRDRGGPGGERSKEGAPVAPEDAAAPAAVAAARASDKTDSDKGGGEGGSGAAPLIGAAAGGALVLAGVWWRRRRRGPLTP
jgi:prenyltransferase beta subunit